MKIIELLQDLGIDYREFGQHHHCTENFLQIDCPLCSKNSGRFKLGINLSFFYCNCWSCGPQSLASVISEIKDIHYQKAKTLLGSLDKERSQPLEKRGKLLLPKGLQKLGDNHQKYLEKRGFNPNELERLWGIQGIGLAAKLAWRIFIPITYQGRTVSWTTRTLTENGQRYQNARPDQEEVSMKSLLYGEDYTRHSIIVVEGPTDVWKIGPGTVGTMGVNYTKEQLLKISRYPKRTVIFDNEESAQRRARELCKLLAPFPGVTQNVILNQKDPGESTTQEVDKIRTSFLQ